MVLTGTVKTSVILWSYKISQNFTSYLFNYIKEIGTIMVSVVNSKKKSAILKEISPLVQHDRFQNIKKLGNGTYGEVYSAFDLQFKERVAIKRFKTLNGYSWGISALAIREITIMKSISHPNIAKLLDIIGTTDLSSESLMLIMELFDTDLQHWIDENDKRITLTNCQSFIFQLLDGCSFLHSQNIMHRDIKPDNVLINLHTGNIKLADLGMARIYNNCNINSYSSYVQALWYRAPEILLGASCYNQSIDTWSIGCIFGEMLNGGKAILRSGDPSKISQIHAIFQILGTPDDDLWPGLCSLEWFRLDFPKWPKRNLSQVITTELNDKTAIDLLTNLLCPDPNTRIGCDEALRASFFLKNFE